VTKINNTTNNLQPHNSSLKSRPREAREGNSGEKATENSYFYPSSVNNNQKREAQVLQQVFQHQQNQQPNQNNQIEASSEAGIDAQRPERDCKYTYFN
jgi:hypothetical protein